MQYPKISIVTPSFNQAAYLEETILSVTGQGYPNLEYIVIDGGSTDGSVDIIKKYSDRITYWVSERDQGMYHAIQKGFEQSTGEIMGWINSDDILHRKSLFVVAELFSIPGVNWVQGLPNVIDEKGRIVRALNFGPWSQIRLFTDEICIQQESTFWSRDLWNRAGGKISTQYKVAGDFELWSRFFQFEKLYTPNCLLGSFRLRRNNQLSLNSDGYNKERDSIIESEINNSGLSKKIEKLTRLKNLKKRLSWTRLLNLHFLIARIDKQIETLHDFPDKIDFNRETQKFEIVS